MAIVFEAATHSYVSIDPQDNTKWKSVTTLLSGLKQPFDSEAIALKCSKNTRKDNKWKGMTPEEIQKAWKRESDRACALGNWYHDQREQDIVGCETMVRHDSELPVIKPLLDNNGKKLAPLQKLINGIYPEHMVYLKSAGICGQSDLVEVVDNTIHITDYKTNKKIDKTSFVNWEGISKKMLGPVSHLDDCNLNHYNLQLSIYMYIILKHNPNLKAGKLIIHHITFEEEEKKDEYGYPILKVSAEGEPIIRNIEVHELPYLKQEVIDILNWYKDNPNAITKK
jgi:hypothetical protein